MAARFILSLDCEGNWGIADHLGRRGQRGLTDRSLRGAYSAILRLLVDYDVAATFAFVGLYGESPAKFHKLRPQLNQLAQSIPEYLGAALREIDEGDGDGWHGGWAVDLVKAARQDDEIALHGVTHVPWARLSRVSANEELDLYEQLSSEVRQSRTFVYPRNQVAHPDLLKRIGIEGYRLAPKSRSRAGSLASEFNLLSPPESDPLSSAGTPLPIPAGYFVNWQHGVRRLVPQSVSAARFALMLRRAEPLTGVVHIWLHPENVATAPETLTLLKALLSRVARARDLGRCEVMTQLQYVRRHRPLLNSLD